MAGAEAGGGAAAGCSSKIVSDSAHPADPREELLDECENIWKQLEECHSKLMNIETETVLNSNGQFSVLPIRMKAAAAECLQWQRRKPELLSTKPEVLLALGKEELQNVKRDLDMLLSTVEAKNKQLEEDLEREEQWQKEQMKLLDVLRGIEEDAKAQVGQLHKKRLENKAFSELQMKIMNVRMYKQELLDALGAFLEEHFPLPEKSGDAKNKCSFEKPSTELMTLHGILEILINQLLMTPHEPYVTISDSFWPPYIELLLRNGIALRHPEDPNKIRLEAFHM